MAGFISILGPTSDSVSGADRPPDCFVNLHLDQIIDAVTARHSESDIARIFYAPLHQLSAVEYRQRVFRDLENDETRAPVGDFVDGMRMVRGRLHVVTNAWHRLQKQGWLIAAVEAYCQTIVLLHDGLTCIQPRSAGLRNFAEHVSRYANSDVFTTLVADTELVREQLRKIRYCVHIKGLQVHVERFDGQTDYSSEVTETFERFATEVSKDYHVALPDFKDMNHVEEQILECVAKLHPESFTLLDDFCGRHEHFIEPTLARFEHEIPFYLSYLTFIRRFTAAGLTFSYPEIVDEPGVMRAQDAFDLALAIKSADDKGPIITNGFQLSNSERIFVVTGPNQGGKTTFARTIGQCAYLASVGCPVPASNLRLTLPDHIYTHFERQEDLSTLHGKLDDELVRIHDVLSRATETSIIVMNESFSSTTVNDALLIGREVLERIIQLRCVAVYVSFLDELSALDPVCVSMVGDVAPDDPTQRTFTFTRRPADGLAYAAALAEKYGLSRDVLQQRISR